MVLSRGKTINKRFWLRKVLFIGRSVLSSKMFKLFENGQFTLIFFSLQIELRRVIAIEHLIGVTKNLQKGSKEFVVHVDHEPDYRVTCD